MALRSFTKPFLLSAAIGALAGLAAPFAAAAADDGARVTPQEWRAKALGRTVRYTTNGAFYGAESYNPDGITAYWRDSSGVCKEGHWSAWTIGGGPIFCFDWPNTGASCWAHLRQDDGVTVVLVDERGRLQNDPSNIFRVDSIEDGWSPCEPEGVS